MSRMILDADGFNAIVTHIKELNYEVRELPANEEGIVVNEIVSEDGTVVARFKTFEGALPLTIQERSAVSSIYEELVDNGMDFAATLMRKTFSSMFPPLDILPQNVLRADRAAARVNGYPENKSDESITPAEIGDEDITDIMVDLLHLADYRALKFAPTVEDAEAATDVIAVHVEGDTYHVRVGVADAVFQAVRRYTEEARGEA